MDTVRQGFRIYNPTRLSRRALIGVLPALAALTATARAQRAGPSAGTATGGALLAANNLSDLASAATARTNLGLGTAATLGTATSAQAAALSSSAVVLTPAVMAAAVQAYLAGLPTTLPSSSGVPWLNGRILSLS